MKIGGGQLRRAVLGIACAIVFGFASGQAAAESSIVLPYPDHFGNFPAATYDETGARIGTAVLQLERSAGSLVTMSVSTSVEGGARTDARAELAVLEGNRGLRLLREYSHSHDQHGKSMGILHVDHVNGEATCTPSPGSSVSASRVSLPKDERVANVPLQLLFLPLVQGETERISFQLFLCGSGAKVVDFSATVVPRSSGHSTHDIVEVRYRPELGAFMSFLAKAVVPDLAFWFDANGQGSYLAHRMPLFTKGPEVMVVLDGIEQELLTARP